MKRIGVTGSQGRLGSVLVNQFDCIPLECDITNRDEVNYVIEKENPDVIINCAALTQVDNAEDDYNTFLDVNGFALSNLMGLKRLIHISTDYVFKGNAGPYSEDDITLSMYNNDELLVRNYEPVNSYGWSKLAGEFYCYGIPDTCIVRTTGLFGSGKEFASYFLSCLDQGIEFNAIETLYGNHTYIPFLALALVKLAQFDVVPSLIHIASFDVISRYEFAVRLAKEFGYDSSKIIPVQSIPEWKAKRPTKGGLKVDLATRLRLPLYSVDQGIRAYKDSIK